MAVLMQSHLRRLTMSIISIVTTTSTHDDHHQAPSFQELIHSDSFMTGLSIIFCSLLACRRAPALTRHRLESPLNS